jgi:putative ABC transport system permease protein
MALIGNLAALLNGIGLAVAFTILLVTANTMSMAVRERRTEIAVLKTLGFSSTLVMSLVIVEAVLLGVLGGGFGVLLAQALVSNLANLPFMGLVLGNFPGLAVSPAVAAVTFTTAVVLGLGAGFVPAMSAYRARITDMLRQA